MTKTEKDNLKKFLSKKFMESVASKMVEGHDPQQDEEDRYFDDEEDILDKDYEEGLKAASSATEDEILDYDDGDRTIWAPGPHEYRREDFIQGYIESMNPKARMTEEFDFDDIPEDDTLIQDDNISDADRPFVSSASPSHEEFLDIQAGPTDDEKQDALEDAYFSGDLDDEDIIEMEDEDEKAADEDDFWGYRYYESKEDEEDPLEDNANEEEYLKNMDDDFEEENFGEDDYDENGNSAPDELIDYNKTENEISDEDLDRFIPSDAAVDDRPFEDENDEAGKWLANYAKDALKKANSRGVAIEDN